MERLLRYTILRLSAWAVVGLTWICQSTAQRLEAVQEQVAAAEQDIATLEKQKKALQGNVKLLKAVEKVKPDLEAIQPEKTLTGAVKGVTVEQVKELKAAAIRGAGAEGRKPTASAENPLDERKAEGGPGEAAA